MVVILQPFLIQFTRFLSKYHKEYIKNNLFLNVMKTQTQGAPHQDAPLLYDDLSCHATMSITGCRLRGVSAATSKRT